MTSTLVPTSTPRPSLHTGPAITNRFDVVVIGASVAGCATARLFAQAGATVALIEQRPSPDAYKVACTHAILPGATPTLQRLGLAQLLTARGVPRPELEMWAPPGGWLTLPEDFDRAWGVTRRTLDPLLRSLATDTPGVEYVPGLAAERLFRDERGRPVGVQLRDRHGRRRAVRAALIVGADGRSSTMARLAGVPGRVRPHNRFTYFAHWEGVAHDPHRPKDRLWLLDPDGAAQFANEDGMTLMVGMFHRSRLPEFRSGLEAAYLRHFAGLPDGPDLTSARRVSKIAGQLDLPNVIRPAAAPGIAFTGDAALATDPLFGVGITFALQTAAWLADATITSLDDPPALDRALARYRRTVLRRLGPHHLQIADYSTGRPMRALERRAFAAAADDPAVARAFGEVLTRQRPLARLLDPRIAARVARPRPKGA